MSLDINGFFCESLRREETKQYTFVGVYPQRHIISKGPNEETAGLNRVSAVFSITGTAAEQPQKLKLVLIKDGTEEFSEEHQFEPPGPDRQSDDVFFQVSGLTIDRLVLTEGSVKYEAQLFINNELSKSCTFELMVKST